jgi:MerR family Zn(II)-responsive transcriptional regulator of zntA
MKIGELAQASGTTTKTLRFYEETGLLPAPERTSAGYRDYRPDVLQRLDFIRRSRVAGLTLAQIRDVLQVRDAGTAPCHHVQQLLSTRVDTLDRQIADLQALRDTVAELRDAATTVDPAHCDATTVCRYV